jgi:hypothetical protein
MASTYRYTREQLKVNYLLNLQLTPSSSETFEEFEFSYIDYLNDKYETSDLRFLRDATDEEHKLYVDALKADIEDRKKLLAA